MWWIIIGAVIALVVMVILMVLFTTKTSKLEIGLSDCEGKGGICAAAAQSCPGGTLNSNAFTCSGDARCCLDRVYGNDDFISNSHLCALPVF